MVEQDARNTMGCCQALKCPNSAYAPPAFHRMQTERGMVNLCKVCADNLLYDRERGEAIAKKMAKKERAAKEAAEKELATVAT